MAVSPYTSLFSPSKTASRIYATSAETPVTKRNPAEKCAGTSPWLQKGSDSPYLEFGEDEDVLQREFSKREELYYYDSGPGIVELNQPGIEAALDQRVALFFQQAVLCYKMPFTFSARGAIDQIGTSPPIRIGKEEEANIVQKREAAHSSTIPALIACPRGGSEQDKFVYLQLSSSYRQQNSTIGMHKEVNGADELLDGKDDQAGGLRKTAVKILNRVAKGLDPREATFQFLRSFKQQAKQTANTLEEEDLRRAVLESYRAGIATIQENIDRDPTIFDSWLSTPIDPTDSQETLLREVVYQRRYQAIQLQQTTENEIGVQIKKVEKVMKRDRSYLPYILLKGANSKDLPILERVLCKTAAIFEQDYQVDPNSGQAYKKFLTRIKNVHSKFKNQIASLQRSLRVSFSSLAKADFVYRAQVFKDLRTKVRGWTQKGFCEEHEETTGREISQSQVSRLEQPSRLPRKKTYKTPLSQRVKQITLEEVSGYAETFKVAPGLLLPGFFTSP